MTPLMILVTVVVSVITSQLTMGFLGIFGIGPYADLKALGEALRRR